VGRALFSAAYNICFEGLWLRPIVHFCKIGMEPGVIVVLLTVIFYITVFNIVVLDRVTGNRTTSSFEIGVRVDIFVVLSSNNMFEIEGYGDMLKK
jgi:hypothetical protein